MIASLTLAAVHSGGISISLLGVIVGLVLAALVYWLFADVIAFRNSHTVGVLLAVLVFLVCAFDVGVN